VPHPSSSGKSRHRSPSFPFISLREAVERAKAFDQAERGNAAWPAVAVTHWGYESAKSSGGLRTIAALRAYGLLEKEGSKVRLSARALQILREDTPAPRRQALLREAALLPRVHQAVLDEYRQGLPSDANLISDLVDQLGFNPRSVGDFIRNLKDTLALTGLPEPSEAAAPPPSLPPVQEASPYSAPLERPFSLIGGGEGLLRVPRKIQRGEAELLRALFDLWLETVTEPD
jgi:hypothetical protein